MVVLRATLRRILRIFGWLFAASALLGTVAFGLFCFTFATGPSWYGDDCDDYECRGQIDIRSAYERPRKPEDLPPWRWSDEDSAMHHQLCRGEWVPGCEPPMLCQGVLERWILADHLDDETDPRAVLSIRSFDLETGEEGSCEAVLRPPTETELRTHHLNTGIAIFGRNDSTLYTWEYDRDCQLLDQRQLPSSALYAQSLHFQAPPLEPRIRASNHGVYFETDGDCGSSSCGLKVWEGQTPRASEHRLLQPNGIATGYDDDYVWWAYWRDEKWYVSVIDRETHERVFSRAGSTEGLAKDSPIRGLRIEDDRLTIEFERKDSALAALSGRPGPSRFETRVYDMDTSVLAAQVIRRTQLQFDGKLRPRWDDDAKQLPASPR